MMTFFDYIRPIYPYLHSMRNIAAEGNQQVFTIDLKLPKDWEVEKFMTMEEQVTLKLQDTTDRLKLYSFISEYSEHNVNVLFDRIIYVIDKNVEMQKKQVLLHNKINELKLKFEQLSLEELEGIQFLTDKKDEETTTLFAANAGTIGK